MCSNHSRCSKRRPLSPFLFAIAIEHLRFLIDEAVKGDKWKPIKLSRDVPQISHLFFTDDLLLFNKADMKQGGVQRILQEHSRYAAHKITTSKLQIYFCNRRANTRSHILVGRR
ncbi:hypothetical protein PVK06_041457 [Gossypium arboreum]|uniref:Reverse transcriptase n=1 Tax=Gossypium arboreum TaxID=29729 RepID=A0ABR0N895_GOSAR|nr:hypothetical protein PVK06_041457 [Gossypium arboreum]